MWLSSILFWGLLITGLVQILCRHMTYQFNGDGKLLTVWSNSWYRSQHKTSNLKVGGKRVSFETRLLKQALSIAAILILAGYWFKWPLRALSGVLIDHIGTSYLSNTTLGMTNYITLLYVIEWVCSLSEIYHFKKNNNNVLYIKVHSYLL